ncbi:MAG TPA: PspC domain-containing protein [Candidatus Colwellbacteria bacterium]|nr:PspC domain-containing protein [Candidatus Colwellbacteria bacterium]HQA95915.1 PspC domain-containing protein [Candidatus Colwellbacteria bacterium]
MPEKIRKIYRSRTDRIIFGVCGGLGEYFEVDPVIFRLLFVLFAFMASGILIYLISAIIIPLESKKTAKTIED